MGVVGVVAGFIIRSGLSTPAPVVPKAAPAESVVDASLPDQPTAMPDEPSGPQLVDDDGRTLWDSPTDGPPIDLAYLPPGCQMIVALRPAAIAASVPGNKALRGLGPTAEALVSAAEAKSGVRFDAMERLFIGLRPAAAGEIETTLVVRTNGELKPRRGVDSPEAGVAVVATPSTAREIQELGGSPPPLRRELELLAKHTDADRHCSILVAPNFLYADGKPLFSGSIAALHEPLFLETPDEVRGLMLSFDCGDRFYWELRAASAAEMPATRLAATIQQRIAAWPSALQLAVLDMNPLPHGRRVVAGLPAMVRVATEYTRTGVQDGHAVLNSYLPASAGASLALAAELSLAQLSAGVTGGMAAAPPSTTEPRTVAEKLRAPATVSFARDTLEMAVRYLSDEMATPITILGADLQLEGITKNQSFEIDVQNRPAEEVFLEILTRANPDKTATGPSDPKQKLVYVVNGDEIVVTTRAAAAKRGDTLPAAFVE